MSVHLPDQPRPFIPTTEGGNTGGANTRIPDSPPCEVSGNAPPSLLWDVQPQYMQPQYVQARKGLTSPAGSRDRMVLDSEQFAFYQIQGQATEESLGFWHDPREDMYEDM